MAVADAGRLMTDRHQHMSQSAFPFDTKGG